jgi:hypothetical protein
MFDGAILACPLGGCGSSPPTTLVPRVDSPSHLVLDANFVYYTTSFGGTVAKCGLDGRNYALLFSGNSKPFDLVVDAVNVHFTDMVNGYVFECSLSGCLLPRALASTEKKPWGIAIDSTDVFWADGPDNKPGAIRKAPK